MNLNIVKYTNANALEANWTDEEGAVIRCHAYADVQMQMLRDDVARFGGDLAPYEELIAEVEAAIEPPPLPDAAGLRAALLASLAAQYEQRMQVIAANYPPSERESWPVQTSEARALLADAQLSTPWIDAAATARGIDRVELAQRIAAKDAAYRVISGTLSGVRQGIEDAIGAAGDDVGGLQQIDVEAGWPAGI